MGRPPGSRNADYEAKRTALAERVAATLAANPAGHTSLRELSRAADVSVSTMRHYFGDRDGVVIAAIEHLGATTTAELNAQVCDLSQEDPIARLHAYMRCVCKAWTQGTLGRAHAVGAAEGLYSPIGLAYREHLMAPLHELSLTVIGAIEDEGLASFRDRDQAASALLSPLCMQLTTHIGLDPEHTECSAAFEDFAEAFLPAFLDGWTTPDA